MKIGYRLTVPCSERTEVPRLGDLYPGRQDFYKDLVMDGVPSVSWLQNYVLLLSIMYLRQVIHYQYGH